MEVTPLVHSIKDRFVEFKLKMVSVDTSITLAFGVLGTVIGVMGVFIGYLTLRAKAIANHSNLRDLEHIRIQRHEHTHIVTPRYTRGELDNKPVRWQD